ncbi:hypothetical protein [Hydrogenophaga sp. 2FB]|uniref:hypothetical protein n=1 Tax=Hydrogenophaga sp. 2FB TaxID=2502187 RepID=UPI0010F92BE4|nr:hypothetical protein [Hydrogenophaga sp. 2FB]
MSAASLALAAHNPTALPAPIPGAPRVLTVTNTGVAAAQAVALDPSVVLPAGTTIVGNCGGTLAPLASCTFTITPGTVATTAPVTLSIQGSNTNTVTSSVQVLAYGSVYQGGHVFAIDDATPNTGSVGGKVAAMSNASAYWSPNADRIGGIDERSVAPCAGARDGDCNTRAIVAHYTGLGTDSTTYAAGMCSASSADGYSDWYLPAICETGYDGRGGSSPRCGSQAAPAQQNMLSNLFDKGVVGGPGSGFYWTSTAHATFPAEAWLQVYQPAASLQVSFPRSSMVAYLRCVRAISS